MHTTQIIDTTLREGQQHGSVSFSTSQALALAHALDFFGVDWIEVGHPVISEQDALTAHALCHIGLNAQTLAHARACSKDVRAAADSGAQWVGIFAGINATALRYKLNCTRETVLARVFASVSEAKRLGLKVRFTCEDASRTSLDLVEAIYNSALKAGADRISFADTVGIMTPERMRRVIGYLYEKYGPIVHAHCHNDFGLATANALAAAEAGAAAVDASIEGIGERCGIAPLAEVAAALALLYRRDSRRRLAQLPLLSHLLRTIAGQDCDTRAVVGRFAFTHKAGLHINAVTQQPAIYEAFAPDLVGRKRELKASRLMGKKAKEALGC